MQPLIRSVNYVISSALAYESGWPFRVNAFLSSFSPAYSL